MESVYQVTEVTSVIYKLIKHYITHTKKNCISLTVLVRGSISGGGMGLGWYTLSPGFNMIGRLIVDTVV